MAGTLDKVCRRDSRGRHGQSDMWRQNLHSGGRRCGCQGGQRASRNKRPVRRGVVPDVRGQRGRGHGFLIARFDSRRGAGYIQPVVRQILQPPLIHLIRLSRRQKTETHFCILGSGIIDLARGEPPGPAGCVRPHRGYS